jgi:hypothetical protein
MKYVRASSLTDWRRWIAALCVALLAFLLVEPVSHAATISEAASWSEAVSSSYNIASDGGGESDGSSPATPAGGQHCCACAHANSIAPALHGTATLQISAQLLFVRHIGDAPQSAPQGLDRPPKPIAIA